jgi:hypothetical protein
MKDFCNSNCWTLKRVHGRGGWYSQLSHSSVFAKCEGTERHKEKVTLDRVWHCWHHEQVSVWRGANSSHDVVQKESGIRKRKEAMVHFMKASLESLMNSMTTVRIHNVIHLEATNVQPSSSTWPIICLDLHRCYGQYHITSPFKSISSQDSRFSLEHNFLPHVSIVHLCNLKLCP